MTAIDIQTKNDDALAALFQKHGTELKAASGAIIAHQGARSNLVYRVMRGCVRSCVYSENGHRNIVRFFRPGDYIGLTETLQWSAAQEAVDNVVLQAVPRALFESRLLAADCPGVLAGFRRELCRLVEEQQALILLTSQTTAIERVRLFLKDFAARCERAGFVALPMGRGDIADHLGLSVETVSRAFTKLKATRQIELNGANHFRFQSRDPAFFGLANAA